MNMSSKVLFIADAWDTLDHARDTTLYLAHIAMKTHQAECFWAEPSDLFLRMGKLFVRTKGMLHPAGNSSARLESGAQELAIADLHSVHWRKDPPVDLRTYRLWSLIDSSPENLQFLNPAKALLKWNEKFAPFHFPEWAIPALVTDSLLECKRFFSENSTSGLVLKPVGEAASRGVQILPANWDDARSVIEKLISTSGPWIMIQPYDENVHHVGETRAFMIGGKIAGALCKRPQANRTIMSLDAPAAERPALEVCELTAEQSERAAHIARELQSDGVQIATIDFIGSRLLEINVTSPGLIRWMDETSPTLALGSKYWKTVFGN